MIQPFLHPCGPAGRCAHRASSIPPRLTRASVLRRFDRYFVKQICLRFIAIVKPKNNETSRAD